MGKIKKLLESELIGGNQNTEVYPVTSTKAVYDSDNNSLDNILNTTESRLFKVEDDLGTVVEKTMNVDSSYDLKYTNTGGTIEGNYSVMEKTGIVYNLTLFSFINIKTEFPTSGTYHVFAKVRLVTTSENRKAVMLNSIQSNNATINTNNKEFPTNTVCKLYLGKVTFTARPSYFYLCSIQVKNLQGSNVGDTETIKLEYYGGYLVPDEIVGKSNTDEIAEELDYVSYPCMITLSGWKDNIDTALVSINEDLSSNKAKIEELSEDINTTNNTINNSFLKIVSAYDVRKDMFSVGNGFTDEGDFIRVVIPQPTYSKSFQTKSYFKADAGKYSVYAKLKISTDESYDTTDLFANVYLRRQGGGSTNSGKYNIPLNKLTSVYLGDFDDGGTTSYFYISLEYIRKDGPTGINQTALGNVTFDFYGAYYVKESSISDVKEVIQNYIDYSSLTTLLVSKALISEISTNSNKSEYSTYSEKSGITENIDNIFRKSNIKIYGDSLVVYIPWDNLKKIFEVESVMQGIGGIKVCNNSETVNYGLCSIEKIASFPRNMKLLVIYGGANDGAETLKPPYSLDESRLGNISDEPLKIADMLNYRVTSSNITNTNTLGRAQTFYQGYKTMLRNFMALYPNCHIICVTQHRYYYYITSEGGFSETPILRRDAYAKVKAIREVAEEYSVPVCDLWATSGVNDSNRRYTLIDMAGVLVHQTEATALREESLIINKILEIAPKFEIPNYTTTNGEDIIEMKKWVVDVRDEVECNVMTLDEAIQAFIQKTTSDGIELKNNMLLPFYYADKYLSKVYILKDYTQPSLTASWEEWVGGVIDDPNKPD